MERWVVFIDYHTTVDQVGRTWKRHRVLVSSLGRVSHKGQILPTNHCGPMGYLTVHFHGRGHYVHQMVTTAFHGPRPVGKEPRHLDGNHSNNRADNLCWGTRQQNIADAIAHGTHISLRNKGTNNPMSAASRLRRSKES